jgi:hypothetical protein
MSASFKDGWHIIIARYFGEDKENGLREICIFVAEKKVHRDSEAYPREKS